MIKNKMNFPLAVDTTDIKSTTGVLYTATDKEVEAYTIGYVPWNLIEESVLLKGLAKGDCGSTSTDFTYTVSDTFPITKGVPFCYSYADSITDTDINAYNDGNGYVDLPWGVETNAGIIHAYNTDNIVINSPNTIPETNTISAVFNMFAVYLPEGTEGGASTSSGENGWVTKLVQKTASIDILNLTFSVTSSTDGSYMPVGATFTEADLQTADPNGIMKKANGTTTYGGVIYNITVYCAITSAYISIGTANNLKDGFLQIDNIRYSATSSGSNTPMYTVFAHNTTKSNVFTCNGINTNIEITFPSNTYYYIEISEDSYDYFKYTTYYLDSNNFLSGGFSETDLKIIRSIARPIYKVSGAFYVAEFNDDYSITGELILYSQARDWQKNINADTNDFDPNGFPERDLILKNQKISDFINRFIDGRAGSTNSFESSRMEN